MVTSRKAFHFIVLTVLLWSTLFGRGNIVQAGNLLQMAANEQTQADDPLCLKDHSPAGTWTGIEFQVMKNGTLYFLFSDASGYSHLYTSSDGVAFTERNIGTWITLDFLADFDDTLYFIFQDVSYNWHL